MFAKKITLNNYLLKITLCALLVLTSCNKKGRWRDVLDQKLDKSYNEYQNELFNPKEDDSHYSAGKPLLPDLTPIIAMPDEPVIASDKLVSISVNEDIPIKDVLVELTRMADVDAEIDSKINSLGGIIFSVKNKPFGEVIRRIAAIANLRYSVEDNIIKIERDDPYLVNYYVDFINITRSNTSEISVSTSITASSKGEVNSGSEIGSGSRNEIKSSYDGDLWQSVERDISNLININDNSSSNLGDNNKYEMAKPYMSTNKQAGMLSVFTNSKSHKRIKLYLDRVKESVSSQVLIEAKIVEVSLFDEYRTGINWTKINPSLKGGALAKFIPSFKDLSNNDINSKLSLGFFKTGATEFLKDSEHKSFANEGDNLQALVELTQQFGNIRTLSSPRLHAMNNQQAILSFAKNKVYFTLKIDSTNAASNNGAAPSSVSETVNSTVNTVPIGVILSLQPSIDLDSNEITMNIRPTISREVTTVPDPAVAYLAKKNDSQGITSSVPEVEIKELDSIMRIRSGEVMVIGGLMTEEGRNTDEGLPGISKIPLLGNLFKGVSKGSSVKQTVIFIKATIMPTNRAPMEDRYFYDQFIRERDPYKFNFGNKAGV